MWGQRVPLVDVVRAAISEIEQYERVVVNIQQGVLITGRAASDVVHLLAELVENAAVFSSAQVLVSGHMLTTGGVLVQIADEGVGIAQQDLQHANWRLDNPPVIDVGVSRRMGLFVVGRLAARHGIRVRLTQVQPRGVLALVWLPERVAELETAPLPSSPLRGFEADAPPAAAWMTAFFPSPVVTSAAGLPTRVPNGNFAPGSIRRPAGQHARHET
jgi:K+-sensing histidine kinase KdpD